MNLMKANLKALRLCEISDRDSKSSLKNLRSHESKMAKALTIL